MYKLPAFHYLDFDFNLYPCRYDKCQSVEQDLSDDDTEAYVTNLSYYHLVPFERDIME